MIPEPKLKSLYQEVILDHNRSPRNYGELKDATQYGHGFNALCGDDYQLFLKINDQGVIENVAFSGKGCAISKSSASIMTTLIKGKTTDEVETLKNQFLAMMTSETSDPDAKKKVDRMAIFEGVREFPIRVKCATLIWHTLADAMKDRGKS